ncbi:MAG: ABC-2 family transporter protein [Oscillospiraceae bacterium]|nr:ABC-2 family transporter protein [Oscillospiraceae bacterium]
MKLYFKFFAMHLRSAMQYKTSFFLLTLGQFLTSFGTFLSVYFLFARFQNVDGYTFNEVLICYSAILLSYTTAECFFRGFDTFPSIISNGEFDRIMVRPRNEIYQIVCSRIEFARIGRMVMAIVIMFYAIPTSGIHWTPANVGVYVMMWAGGSGIFCGLFIVYAAVCFFTIEGLEFMNIFTDGGRTLSTYPINIYGRGVLIFFTFVIPLACVQYYPFTFITGRSDALLNAFLPLCGFLFLIPCYLFWKFGVGRYKSVGS